MTHSSGACLSIFSLLRFPGAWCCVWLSLWLSTLCSAPHLKCAPSALLWCYVISQCKLRVGYDIETLQLNRPCFLNHLFIPAVWYFQSIQKACDAYWKYKHSSVCAANQNKRQKHHHSRLFIILWLNVDSKNRHQIKKKLYEHTRRCKNLRRCLCWHSSLTCFCKNWGTVLVLSVYVKVCLLCIYFVTPTLTDLVIHRHEQEWMKVNKIHSCLHDSLHAAKLQVFRLFEGKAL